MRPCEGWGYAAPSQGAPRSWESCREQVLPSEREPGPPHLGLWKPEMIDFCCGSRCHGARCMVPCYGSPGKLHAPSVSLSLQSCALLPVLSLSPSPHCTPHPWGHSPSRGSVTIAILTAPGPLSPRSSSAELFTVIAWSREEVSKRWEKYPQK